MPLTEAVWLQFAEQVFGVAVRTPIWENGGHMGSESVPHTRGLATAVFQQYTPFSHNACRKTTDDRQRT